MTKMDDFLQKYMKVKKQTIRRKTQEWKKYKSTSSSTPPAICHRSRRTKTEGSKSSCFNP